MKKPHLKKRKVSKPERPSKSLKTITRLASAHTWTSMLTLKPKTTIDEDSSNEFQEYITGLLRRELRGHEIGFLLVREFGTGSSEGEDPNRSHFHIVLTRDLPEEITERLQTAFLRKCRLPNNQSRTFDYRIHTKDGPPMFGKYVSKLDKNGIDVIHPPADWDYRKLERPYRYGYLDGENAGGDSYSYMDLMNILSVLC